MLYPRAIIDRRLAVFGPVRARDSQRLQIRDQIIDLMLAQFANARDFLRAMRPAQGLAERLGAASCRYGSLS